MTDDDYAFCKVNTNKKNGRNVGANGILDACSVNHLRIRYGLILTILSLKERDMRCRKIQESFFRTLVRFLSLKTTNVKILITVG